MSGLRFVLSVVLLKKDLAKCLDLCLILRCSETSYVIYFLHELHFSDDNSKKKKERCGIECVCR